MEKIICDKCQSKNNVNRTNCWMCGKELKNNVITTEECKKIKIIPLIFIVVIIIIVVATIIFHCINTKAKNKIDNSKIVVSQSDIKSFELEKKEKVEDFEYYIDEKWRVGDSSTTSKFYYPSYNTMININYYEDEMITNKYSFQNYFDEWIDGFKSSFKNYKEISKEVKDEKYGMLRWYSEIEGNKIEGIMYLFLVENKCYCIAFSSKNSITKDFENKIEKFISKTNFADLICEVSTENMNLTDYVAGTYSINALFDEDVKSRKSQAIGAIHFNNDGSLNIKFGILYYNAYTTSKKELNGKYGKIGNNYYMCVYSDLNTSDENYYKIIKDENNNLRFELLSGFDIVGNTNSEFKALYISADNELDSQYEKGKNEVNSLAENYKIINVSDNTTNATSHTQTITLGMKNALKKAKEYLETMAFSRQGLIEQLEYEGFSNEQIQYAIDGVGY